MRKIELAEGSATLPVVCGRSLNHARKRRTVPFSWGLNVSQVKGTAVHFWAWGTEQPRLKCHAPEKLGPLAVSGENGLLLL